MAAIGLVVLGDSPEPTAPAARSMTGELDSSCRPAVSSSGPVAMKRSNGARGSRSAGASRAVSLDVIEAALRDRSPGRASSDYHHSARPIPRARYRGRPASSPAGSAGVSAAGRAVHDARPGLLARRPDARHGALEQRGAGRVRLWEAATGGSSANLPAPVRAREACWAGLLADGRMLAGVVGRFALPSPAARGRPLGRGVPPGSPDAPRSGTADRHHRLRTRRPDARLRR